MTAFLLTAVLAVCPGDPEDAGQLASYGGLVALGAGMAGTGASMYGARTLLHRGVETERYWITAVVSAALAAGGWMIYGFGVDARATAQYDDLRCQMEALRIGQGKKDGLQ